MFKIKLVETSPTQREGQFYQIWEVNGKEYGSTAEWGNVEFEDEDLVLIDDPEVTAHHIITLALHGNGPTSDGEEHDWDQRDLINALRQGGYL